MRYRPFTKSGVSASAITLVLRDELHRPSDWVKLIYAALEAGVNSFELSSAHPAPAEALREALAQVDRRMLVITTRLGRLAGPKGETVPDFRSESLMNAFNALRELTGIERFDAVVLDEPRAGELSQQAMTQLTGLRDNGQIRMLGIAGHDEATDGYVASGAFDLLATHFNIKSGWPERNRIKQATQRGMTIVGCDYLVREDAAAEEAQPKKGLARFFAKRPAPLASGPYEFLSETPNWSPEEICLVYALTEPSLATVRVSAASAEEIEALAASTDRDLPTGLAAQIEMARFSQVA